MMHLNRLFVELLPARNRILHAPWGLQPIAYTPLIGDARILSSRFGLSPSSFPRYSCAEVSFGCRKQSIQYAQPNTIGKR